MVIFYVSTNSPPSKEGNRTSVDVPKGKDEDVTVNEQVSKQVAADRDRPEEPHGKRDKVILEVGASSTTLREGKGRRAPPQGMMRICRGERGCMECSSSGPPPKDPEGGRLRGRGGTRETSAGS